MNREEQAMQRTLVEFAQYLPKIRDAIYHVPNGGKRGKVEAAILKGMGVRAGVSDLHIPVPVLHRPLRGDEALGLWIELKAGKGRLSQAQADWIRYMHTLGYDAHVIDNLDRGMELLRNYNSRIIEAEIESR